MNDLSKCPKCGGYADNGHDRCLPPSPYYCIRCDPNSAVGYNDDWVCVEYSGSKGLFTITRTNGSKIELSYDELTHES